MKVPDLLKRLQDAKRTYAQNEDDIRDLQELNDFLMEDIRDILKELHREETVSP
jgi:hypothetical protein